MLKEFSVSQQPAMMVIPHFLTLPHIRPSFQLLLSVLVKLWPASPRRGTTKSILLHLVWGFLARRYQVAMFLGKELPWLVPMSLLLLP
jgi:hypothetical protein